MTHNQNEIQKDNKKARSKYLLLILVLLVVGGFSGFFCAMAADHWNAASVQQMLVHGLQSILVYGIPVAALLTLLPAAVLLRQAKQKLSAWDGEEETVPEIVEWKLTCVMTILSVLMPVEFFFLAAGLVYGGHHGLDSIIVSLEMLVALFLLIWLQQKVVDLTRTLNPEKKGSVYDFDFQKKWVSSFDENERRQMGEASAKAFQVTNMACVILWMLLIFSHLFFQTGLIPIAVVLLIWSILQGSYLWNCLKMSRPAKK